MLCRSSWISASWACFLSASCWRMLSTIRSSCAVHRGNGRSACAPEMSDSRERQFSDACVAEMSSSPLSRSISPWRRLV
uniref:Putative secreted protein n=1 Tax=Ixodes ricinus TaxID=34613 RepID=A0A6B0U5H7_IXORI